jgi:DNA-binding NarL/FixJ family response regulator
MIGLLVCDDHDMVRTGLLRALQASGNYNILGEAATADAALRMVEANLNADVLLLDLNLGKAGLSAGIGLIALLGKINPKLHILVVSMHNEPEVVQSALDAGAKGYVTKDSAISVLEQGIAQIQRGRKFLDPSLVESLIFKSRRNKSDKWDASLTGREKEVLDKLIGGERVSDIALGMGLSVKTVSTHKMRLMEKLNVENNAELVKLGMLHRYYS